MAAIVFVGFLVAILLDIDRETHEYSSAACARTRWRVRARAHALTRGGTRTSSREFGSRVLSLQIRGGGDCLENGDVGSHLSSIVNIEVASRRRARASVSARVNRRRNLLSNAARLHKTELFPAYERNYRDS